MFCGVTKLRAKPGCPPHWPYAGTQWSRGESQQTARGIKKLPAFLQELGYEVAGFGKVAHYNHDQDYGFNHYDKRHDPEVISEFLRQRDSSKPLCLFVGSHAPHVPWSTNSVYDPKLLDLPPTHVDTPATREFRARY